MAIGDVLSLTAIGAALVDPAGRSVDYNGFVVGVKFSTMTSRDVATTAVFDLSSLVIQVSDPGFDTSGNPTTVFRTIRGAKDANQPTGYPARWPFPAVWAAATFAAKRYVQSGDVPYYTALGGVSSNAPTGTTVGGTTTGADGVSWKCVGTGNPFLNAQSPTGNGTPFGYFDFAAAGDCTQYAVIDDYIYAGTTIISATIAAGAYVTTGAGAASSNASAAIPSLVKTSTLAYEMPCVAMVSSPHQRSTGSIDCEVFVTHPRGDIGGQMAACVKFQAWNAARTVSSAIVTVGASSLSNIITAASPAGYALEVYRGTLNTSGIAYDPSAFIEYEVFPWLGTQTFKSSRDGEGADFTAGITPVIQPGCVYGPVYRTPSNGKFYALSNAGTGAGAVTAPTQASGASAADANGYVWQFFSADTTSRLLSANPQARHHFISDPANIYRKSFTFVDPAGSLTTGATTGVYTSLAALQAAFSASGTAICYSTPQNANAACYTANAATGTGQHLDVGGSEIYLRANATPYFSGAAGQTMRGGGSTGGAEWQYIKADPAAAAGTVLIFGNYFRMNDRVWFGEGISETTIANGTETFATLVDPTAFGQPNAELYLNKFTYSAPINGSNGFTIRAGLIWVRNCTFGTMAKNPGSDGSASQIHDAMGTKFTALNINTSVMLANRATGVNGAMNDTSTFYNPTKMFIVCGHNFYTSGTTGQVCLVNMCRGVAGLLNPWRGGAFVNNILEPLQGGGKALQLGADASQGDLTNWTVTGNTTVGERTNLFYSDAAAPGKRSRIHVFNNAIWGYNAVDDYLSHNATPLRSGARALNLCTTYSVRQFNNRVYGGGIGTVDGGIYRLGYNTNITLTSGTPGLIQLGEFVRDASAIGTAAGGGDYTPTATASIRAMATVINSQFDQRGSVRRIGGAVGALEGVFATLTYRMTMMGVG